MLRPARPAILAGPGETPWQDSRERGEAVQDFDASEAEPRRRLLTRGDIPRLKPPSHGPRMPRGCLSALPGATPRTYGMLLAGPTSGAQCPGWRTGRRWFPAPPERSGDEARASRRWVTLARRGQRVTRVARDGTVHQIGPHGGVSTQGRERLRIGRQEVRDEYAS